MMMQNMSYDERGRAIQAMIDSKQVTLVETEHYLKSCGPHRLKRSRTWGTKEVATKAYKVMLNGIEVGEVRNEVRMTSDTTSSGVRIRDYYHIEWGIRCNCGRHYQMPRTTSENGANYYYFDPCRHGTAGDLTRKAAVRRIVEHYFNMVERGMPDYANAIKEEVTK